MPPPDKPKSARDKWFERLEEIVKDNPPPVSAAPTTPPSTGGGGGFMRGNLSALGPAFSATVDALDAYTEAGLSTLGRGGIYDQSRLAGMVPSSLPSLDPINLLGIVPGSQLPLQYIRSREANPESIEAMRQFGAAAAQDITDMPFRDFTSQMAEQFETRGTADKIFTSMLLDPTAVIPFGAAGKGIKAGVTAAPDIVRGIPGAGRAAMEVPGAIRGAVEDVVSPVARQFTRSTTPTTMKSRPTGQFESPQGEVFARPGGVPGVSMTDPIFEAPVEELIRRSPELTADLIRRSPDIAREAVTSAVQPARKAIGDITETAKQYGDPDYWRYQSPTRAAIQRTKVSILDAAKRLDETPDAAIRFASEILERVSEGGRSVSRLLMLDEAPVPGPQRGWATYRADRGPWQASKREEWVKGQLSYSKIYGVKPDEDVVRFGQEVLESSEIQNLLDTIPGFRQQLIRGFRDWGPNILRALRLRPQADQPGLGISLVTKYAPVDVQQVAAKLLRLIPELGKAQKVKEAVQRADTAASLGQATARGATQSSAREGVKEFYSAMGGPRTDASVDLTKLNESFSDSEKKLLEDWIWNNAGDASIAPEGYTGSVRALGGEGLRPFDHSRATAALVDFLQNGVVPRRGELDLLSDIISPKFANELNKKRKNTIGKTGFTYGELFGDLINAPRSMISSVDFSMFLRQGGMLLPRHPGIAKRAANLAARAMAPGGEEVTSIVMQSIRNSNRYDDYVNTGNLFLHNVDARQIGRFDVREEAFMSSLAGKVPWVRASERAYGTYLNKLRFDVMDDMVRKYEGALGKRLDPTIQEDSQILLDFGKYVNAVTGRGPMSKGGENDIMRGIAVFMNGLFFSPRLFTSRIAAPVYAIKNMRGAAGEIVNSLYPAAVAGDPQARAAYRAMSRIVAEQMGSWLLGGIGILAGLKAFEAKAGVPVSVGIDPRSTNFGKIRVGDSRYDIWSGYTQIARTMFQAATGEAISAQTGVLRPVSRKDVLVNFVQSKFAPQVSVVVDYNLTGLTGDKFGTGTGFLGEDRDILEDMKDFKGFVTADDESFWTRIMTPLFIRNLADTIQEGMTPLHVGNMNERESINEKPSLLLEVAKALPAAGAEFLGMGVTTFKTRDDMALEMTQDRVGGPVTYSELQDFEQTQIDEAFEERTASMGRTYTQGLRGELSALDKSEERQLALLVQNVRDGEMLRADLVDRYYGIKDDIRQQRSAAFTQYFGGDTEKRDRYRREALGPIGTLVEELAIALEKAREAGAGRKLLPAEYSAIVDEWEIRMLNTQGQPGEAAVLRRRMNQHQVDIPPELLELLPDSVKARYNAARTLRAMHGAGEIRPELYGE